MVESRLSYLLSKNMLSFKNKRILLQLIPFGLIPFIFSIVYSFLEKGILGNHPFYPSTGNPYAFQLVIPAIVSMLAGLTVGVLEVFYVNRWFQARSFFKKIVLKSIIYLLTTIAATLIIIITVNVLEFEENLLDRSIWNILTLFPSSLSFWSIIIYFTLSVLFCLFYAEVSDNIGQAVLLNFFTGKYHQPLEEERVFMFLDMKSSTAFAEQLGHVQYFTMLKEYYVDLSDTIIQYGGEIYQYVGDEVIITWKLKRGFANHSLNCFFAMKENLQHQATKYQSKYGLIPTFKAGIHYGKVTTGEIGVIKKEIIFSGDVLNTTARIQGLCNSYEVDLLVSEKLIKALEDDKMFNPLALGEVELRGRSERLNLYTIQKVPLV